MTEFPVRLRIGLRVPAVALLAADTPTAPRCFPSRACQIMETVQELSNLCKFWRSEENRTLIRFTENFQPIINHVAPISRVDFYPWRALEIDSKPG
jgi:hypothetical protein